MKGKRLLAILLSMLLCVAAIIPASAATAADWQKTATPAYRFFFSSWIASPLRNMLPSLGEGVGLDLTGDLFTNQFVDDLIYEIIAAAGAMANMIAPLHATLTALMPDLSPAAQAHVTQLMADGQITTTAPNNTWVHLLTLNIDWGVECRDTLLQYGVVPVRRFSSFVFRDDIRARWQSHYVPAFRALGVPDAYIADQDTLNAAWTAAQNFLTPADDLLRAVFTAVLYFTEAMENDLLGYLIANLPNLVQNEAAINQLSMPLLGNPGFNPAGTSRNINLATDGYWLNADLTPRGGTFVGDLLLGFLEVDVTAGGFLAFFEDTLANEFYEMGIEMPEIDWDLVYHAGDMVYVDGEYEFVTDERLMETLILRYLARVNANRDNRPVLQGLVRDAVPGPGFIGSIVAWAAPTVLGWIFDFSEICVCPPCECDLSAPEAECECPPCECPQPPTFLQAFLNGLGWGVAGAGSVAMLFVVFSFFATIFRV